MDRYQKLALIGPLLGTFFGVVIATLVHPVLAQDQGFSIVFVLGTALLIFILEESCRYVFNRVLDSKPFRTLYFGKDLHEGPWIDRVIRDQPIKPGEATTIFGICEVTRSGETFSYSGINYTAEGQPIGHFESEASHLEGRTLQYMYKSTGTFDPPEENNGRGDISFSDHDHFVGGFFDIRRHRPHRVEGKRLTNEEFSRANKNSVTEVPALIEKYFPDHSIHGASAP